MSDTHLSCQETPLAWPASVDISDIEVCTMCALQLQTPQSGSLQVLTRRQQGGVGDGVSVDESSTVSADYRGQRYLLEEAILHVPGLHVFPGQKSPYGAEYHIHLRTLSEPLRYITIVVPVSYRKGEKATSTQAAEETYFAAINSKPDPNATRPTLDVLIPAGTEFIQYAGPDIRGRTKEIPEPEETCRGLKSGEDRQFLLMLHVASIRATDLERIPREGSMSSDPRDLPAPGTRPTANVPRDRILKLTILARPGVRYGPTSHHPKPTPVQQNEITCNPIRIENGEPVVDISSQTVNINTLLGHEDNTLLKSETGKSKKLTPLDMVASVSAVLCAIAVVIFLDKFVFSYVWGWFFTAESAALIDSRTRNFFILKLMIVITAVSGVIWNNASS